MTELGAYLAYQQKDRESIHGDFLEGSLLSDYWQINEKVGCTYTLGVKYRWIGSALYLVGAGETGSEHGWISSTGAGNWLFGDGEGMSSWAFHASGDDSVGVYVPTEANAFPFTFPITFT
jgi:hypothetical protein